MEKQKAYSYIRFSTKGQIEGRSLQRQFERAQEYANKNKLELDTSLQDLGVSSFRGNNRKKGALGDFFEKIRVGEITSGSVLVIENMDRLSRENPWEASEQFRQIINAGIKIVTLSYPRREYTKEILKTKRGALRDVVDEIERAHEESRRKRDLLADAWQQKRKNVTAKKVKLTRRVPCWIKLPEKPANDDENKFGFDFEFIPEVCSAIKKIFKYKCKGYGATKIMTIMNKEPDVWKPPKSKRNAEGGWRESFVNRLLYNNRQLIGEYHPHKIIDGKRIADPDIEPIKNYFVDKHTKKPVISEDLFYKVQKIIQQNRALNKGFGGGRLYKVDNLFVSYTKCGFCGGTMHYINKGNPPKGGKYLMCDVSRRKLMTDDGKRQCNAKAVSYKEFEDIIFKNFTELDVSRLFPGNDELITRRKGIGDEITTNNGIIEDRERKIKNLVATISDKNDEKARKPYEKAIEAHQSGIQKLKEKNQVLEDELRASEKENEELEKRFNTVNEVRQQLENIKDEEEIKDTRLRLREALRRSIEKIQVYPLIKKEEEIEYLKSRLNKTTKQIKQQLKQEPDLGKKKILGSQVLANVLERKIQRLKQNELEPGITLRMDSKHLDRVIIRFRGAGIQEQDEYRDMIKKRTVRLRRHEITLKCD